MATRIRPLVAGNWKMNGLRASDAELKKIIAGAGSLSGKADLMVCPPATLIARFAEAARGSGVAIGGQDCHAKASGAHTGDVAAEMLVAVGVASRTAQRALLGDLDRQRRLVSAQDASPGRNNPIHSVQL
jgi:triosephosphate isomerase